MSKMSELHQTITEYLEQGDNVYRVASVLEIPIELVLAVAEQLDAEPDEKELVFG